MAGDAATSKTLMEAFLSKPSKFKVSGGKITIGQDVGSAAQRVGYSKKTVATGNNIKEHFATDTPRTEGNTTITGTEKMFVTVATEAAAKEMKTDTFVSNVTATNVNSTAYFNHMLDAASTEADTSGTGSHTTAIVVAQVTMSDNITDIDYTQKVDASQFDRLVGDNPAPKMIRVLTKAGKKLTVKVSDSTDFTNAIKETAIDNVEVSIGSASTISGASNFTNANKISFLENLLTEMTSTTLDAVGGTAIKTKLTKLTISSDIDGFDQAKVTLGTKTLQKSL